MTSSADEKRIAFWRDSERYQRGIDSTSSSEEELETLTPLRSYVWDDTRARVVTCGNVSLRFVCGGKYLRNNKQHIEVTCDYTVWKYSGWSIEVHNGEIYTTQGTSVPKCFKLCMKNTQKNNILPPFKFEEVLGPIAMRMKEDKVTHCP